MSRSFPLISKDKVGVIDASVDRATSPSDLSRQEPSSQSGVDLPGVVATGYYAGCLIRRARKAGRCADFRHCGNRIEPGDRYVEGDCDPYAAGGYAHDRLCLKCGGAS